MDRIGIGMVGYGMIGRVHCLGYRDLPSFTRVSSPIYSLPQSVPSTQKPPKQPCRKPASRLGTRIMLTCSQMAPST